MEAVAALSLASNVLQFVDFGLNVLSKGNSLKRSADGTLKEHAELDTVATHLEELISQLDASAEPSLLSLVKKCKEVGQELKEALAILKRRGGTSVWSNYRAALSAVWNKATLDDVEKRLERLRDEMGFHLQVNARRTDAKLSDQLHKIEGHAEDTANGLQVLTEAHRTEFRQLRDSARLIGDSILNRCDGTLTATDNLVSEVKELRQICEKLKTWCEAQGSKEFSSSTPSQREFLESLKFRGMGDREEAIPVAHARTFEWLLMDSEISVSSESEKTNNPLSSYQQERKELRTSLEEKLRSKNIKPAQIEAVLPPETSDQCPGHALQQWLKSGNGIFWIWGKPGCGKSTLMKACVQKLKFKERLETFLNEWSSGSNLLIAKFFFYRPGSSLQKSHLGLLQSILYQILVQKPHLVNFVFTESDQKEAIARLTRLRGTDTPIWSMPKLKTALQKLQQCRNIKIYLHIDGIDEMNAVDENTEIDDLGDASKEIAQILSQIAKCTNFKILTAGRWNPEFETAFGMNNSLNLHEITDLDILHYTVDNLVQENMLRLIPTPRQFMAVVEEIACAAEGVFLWVKIVVQSLLRGISRFENFQQLFSRLQEYPKDLDRLYWFLYENIEPRYAGDAAFWLLAVHAFQGSAKDQLNGYQMSHAESFDSNDIMSLSRMVEEPITEKTSLQILMQQRISTQCPHLFEFGPQGAKYKRIKFAHRTVLDFLSQESVEKSLFSKLQSGKDPVLGVVASRFAEAYTSSGGRKWRSHLKLWTQMQKVKHDDRSTSIIWRQLIYFLKQHKIVGYPEYCPTPSSKGWQCEDELTQLSRLSSSDHTFVHLGVVTGDASSGQFETNPAFFDPLNLADKTDVLLEAIFNNEHMRVHSFLLPRRIHQMINTIFPNGLAAVSVLWNRVLEWFRITVGPTARQERAAMWLVRNFQDDFWPEVVGQLLEAGVGPNTLCRSVWADPDKSKLSPVSVFIRVKYNMRKIISEVIEIRHQIPRALIDSESRVDEILSRLRDAGGEEISVPAENHKDEEVKLLSEDDLMNWEEAEQAIGHDASTRMRRLIYG